MNFEKLEVWQRSARLAAERYKATSQLQVSRNSSLFDRWDQNPNIGIEINYLPREDAGVD